MASFASFQALLAARVQRAPASLCMTNASEEHRMRVERAAISDQQRRISREAAALHAVERLTEKDEDGGLPLPWEQSLRGAASHSVQVGNMFSGLYCQITEPHMDGMEVIRTTKQITEDADRRSAKQQQQQQQQGEHRQQQQREEVVPHGALRRPKNGARSAASPSSSRALLALVQEAARLEQLTRLAQLGGAPKGRRRTRGADEDADADDGRLQLSDLLIRGSDLFAHIDPPEPQQPRAAAAADDSGAAAATASAGEPSTAAASTRAPAVCLSRAGLSFRLSFSEGCTASALVDVRNASASTVHFRWTDADGGAEGAPSAFVLSAPELFVLPRSSLSVCATYAPLHPGVHRQRLRLTPVDVDDESDARDQDGGEQSTLLVLEGVSSDPAVLEPARASAARRTVMAALHAHCAALVTVRARAGRSAEDAAALRPPASVQRALFTRLNGGARLFHHADLSAQWWALWEDARALHRPLERAALQWDMDADTVRRAIDAVPARHRDRVAALSGRLEELRAAGAARPPVHPARAQLLSGLLSAVARGLPTFAQSLRASLRHCEAAPWERRAAAAEAERVGGLSSADGPPAEPQQSSAEEARGDAEWREREQRYREEVAAEARAVLLAAVGAFAQRAQPEGSDAEPEAAAEAEAEATAEAEAAELPRPFRVVLVEPEPVEPTPDSRKPKKKPGQPQTPLSSAARKR